VVQSVSVKIRFNSIPHVRLALRPGESAVSTLKVQDFHFSTVQLTIAAALTDAAIRNTGFQQRRFHLQFDIDHGPSVWSLATTRD
jgi:hypothetical protein